MFALLPFPALALHSQGLRGSHGGCRQPLPTSPDISPAVWEERWAMAPTRRTHKHQPLPKMSPSGSPSQPMGRVPEAEQHRPLRRDLWETTLVWVAESGPPSPDFGSGRCDLSLPWPQVFSSKDQEFCPVVPCPQPSSVKAPGLGQARPSDAPRRINFCNVAAGLDASGCQEGAESRIV